MRLRRLLRDAGFSLASTIMVISLVVVVAFALAGTSVIHLNVSQHVQNAQVAENLAESVVAQAIEHVESSPDFGSHSGDSVSIIPPGAPDGIGGFLTFDPKHQPAYPYSTYNLDNPESKKGFDQRLVPGEAVHLVGTGTYGDVTRHVEAIVHIPKYPYTIACSGTVLSRGGLMVAAADPQDVAHGIAQIDPSKLLPGSIVSNSQATPAITLGPLTRITGDVQAVGTILLDSRGGTVVTGAVKPNAQPVAIPNVDVTSFDPQVQSREGIQTLPAALNGETLEGFSRRTGDLTVNGNLTLDGGVVYVDGNVLVHGAIQGKGAVIATGSTRIEGGVDLKSDSLAALVSGGDVTLKGNGQDSAMFQGLVYTKGNFTADHISLVGSFVANNLHGSTMQLDNVNMLEVTDSNKLTITPTQPATGPVVTGAVQVPGTTGTGSISIQVQYVNGQYVYGVQDPGGLWGVPGAVTTPGQGVGPAPIFAGGQGRTGNGTVGSLVTPLTRAQAIQLIQQLAALYFAPAKFAVDPAILDSLERQATPPPGNSSAAAGGKTGFTVDLNKFLEPADRIHLILWKDF